LASKPSKRLCRLCGTRPCQPARERIRDYVCSKCFASKPNTKRYRTSEKHDDVQRRYDRSPNGRTRQRRFDHSEKGHARDLRYRSQPWVKENAFWRLKSTRRARRLLYSR
jgi:hypothetical protein